MSQAQYPAFSAAAILAPDEGEYLNVLGNRCVVKVGAAQTGGLLMAMESHVDPPAGPPHVHHQYGITIMMSGERKRALE